MLCTDACLNSRVRGKLKHALQVSAQQHNSWQAALSGAQQPVPSSVCSRQLSNELSHYTTTFSISMAFCLQGSAWQQMREQLANSLAPVGLGPCLPAPVSLLTLLPCRQQQGGQASACTIKALCH